MILVRAIEIGAIVLLAAFLFWYVQRLLKNLRMASIEVWSPVMKPLSEMALPGSSGLGERHLTPGQTGAGLDITSEPENEEDFDEPQIPQTVEQFTSVLEKSKPSSIPTAEEEQMQRVISRLADDNPATVAEIIQLWLNEDKKQNG